MTLTSFLTIIAIVFVMFNTALVGVLAVIYAERKVLARLQQRIGPSRTGPWGILQTMADAVKLVLKEDVRPAESDKVVFYLAPLVIFTPIFMLWAVLPLDSTKVLSDIDLGLLYVAAILGLSVVGMVLAGWSSNSKYAMLGSARSAAQLISYELPLILSALGVGLLAQLYSDTPFNLSEIVRAQLSVPFIFVMPLGFVLFMIGALAETARIPFDIPHADEEIVGGAFVEYSGIRWGTFQLAEYTGLITMSVLASILFLGGWNGPFSEKLTWLQPLYLMAKTGFIILLTFWIRAPLPRLRIDQLMAFAWKVIIPISFLNLIIISSALFTGKQLGISDDVVKGIIALLSIISLLLVTYFIGKRRRKRLNNYKARWGSN
tara:strand:+ start:64 stop:1191 length:1128 start_codon:yes stop_codon:yes gene_type:complete